LDLLPAHVASGELDGIAPACFVRRLEVTVPIGIREGANSIQSLHTIGNAPLPRPTFHANAERVCITKEIAKH
jgi:hypothetical protein